MKISIITATYNSQKNIQDCLQSVANQSHKNIEHIVIDGGSTDDTVELVKNSQSVTKWISEPDNGIYDALNKGIQLATGDVIGFLHSDDMLGSSTIIESIANSFSQTNQNSLSFPPGGGNVGVRQAGGRQRGSKNTKETKQKIHGIYGNLLFVHAQNTNKVVRTWHSKPFSYKRVHYGWMPPHPTLFLRKEVYEKHGLFDTSFRIAGDYDFMLRVMLDKEINLVLLPEVITRMRVGGASTSSVAAIIQKMREDIRALRNNGFSFPLRVLAAKNLRKLPQLLKRKLHSTEH